MMNLNDIETVLTCGKKKQTKSLPQAFFKNTRKIALKTGWY